MSSNGDSEADVRARIGKPVSKSWSVKLHLYTAIVIPTAFYACETWRRTAMIAHRLDVFHRRCLRTILSISWRAHAPNEEMMRRAGMERLQAIVTTRIMKVAGHVLRLQRERPAHTAMYWLPEDGRRKRRISKKTWRSTFKEDLEEVGVS